MWGQLSQHGLRVRNVGSDLGAEGVEGGEALFVAEAAAEEEADGTVVQIMVVDEPLNPLKARPRLSRPPRNDIIPAPTIPA